MPSQAIILKVFVSSPSDVKGERLAIVEIVEEINHEWSDFLGIRLEPILWETHCRPAAGKDPQQVINHQIPTDYDIYLAGVFRDQAERYRDDVEVEEVLTYVPEFFASDKRVKLLHRIFTSELERASKILKEAEQIISALKSRRSK